MRTYLSFTKDGQQVFHEEGGKCTGLMKGVPVHTHHASLTTEYTSDPAVVVEVFQLQVDTVLSGPALSRMMYSPGDNAIRAQLGFLDEGEAPDPAEIALVLAFQDGQLNTDSFLLGGKTSSQVARKV